MAKPKTSPKKNDLVPKGGGSPSREVSYQYAAQFTQEAFDGAIELMRNSVNENIKLGAIKIVLDRTLPTLAAMEVTGKDGQQIPIYIFGGGFLPPQPSALTPSNGDPFRLPPVQSPGVAQAVKKDNNGSFGVGKAEPA